MSNHNKANRKLCYLLTNEFEKQELNTRIEMVQNKFEKKLQEKYADKLHWLTGKKVNNVQKTNDQNIRKFDSEIKANMITPNPVKVNEPTTPVIKKHRRFIRHRMWKKAQDKLKAIPVDPLAVYNFQVIEKVYPDKESTRLQREKLWIQRLDSKVNGLNRLA